VSDAMADADRHDAWLSPAQAAAALGVSERTIHRRLAIRRYAVRHVDGRTLVCVPADRQADGFTRGTADMSDTASSPSDISTDVLSDRSDAVLMRPTPATDMADGVTDTVRQAIGVLERLLEQERLRAAEERGRVERERERAGTAEQAAAMWQERARNLEVQVEQLLALPAHEEERTRRWWQWWRRKDE